MPLLLQRADDGGAGGSGGAVVVPMALNIAGGGYGWWAELWEEYLQQVTATYECECVCAGMLSRLRAGLLVYTRMCACALACV